MDLGIITLVLAGLFLAYRMGLVKTTQTITNSANRVIEVYADELVDRAEFDCSREAGKRVVKASSDKAFARPGDWKQHLQSTTEQ